MKQVLHRIVLLFFFAGAMASVATATVQYNIVPHTGFGPGWSLDGGTLTTDGTTGTIQDVAFLQEWRIDITDPDGNVTITSPTDGPVLFPDSPTSSSYDLVATSTQIRFEYVAAVPNAKASFYFGDDPGIWFDAGPDTYGYHIETAGQVTSSIPWAPGDVFVIATRSAVPDADFDQDGDIDGDDFLAWQRNAGTTSGASLAQGDADTNGAVNGDDLSIWQEQFGTITSAATTAVPEPTTLLLAILGMTSVCCLRRRR